MSMLEESRHRFTREEYDAMIAAGVFHPEARLELVDGEIVDMTPQGSRHATGVQLVAEALRPLHTKGFLVRQQLPIALGSTSEPEPDVAVVEGQTRDFRDGHPTSPRLVVEVADSTLAYDRSTKLELYARDHVPEYWILDLVHQTLEVYRSPEGGTYRDRRILGPDDTQAPLCDPSLVLVVRSLLP